MRALSIAKAAANLWDLPRLLTNEGHPVLWYALLWFGYHLAPTPLVLQGISIAIALLAVLVFWLSCPFLRWLKLLFLFSFLPLYEYSVIARNYGISMLLFFVFAAFYGKLRADYAGRWLLAFVLALLANTNVHSAILSGFLTLYWAADSRPTTWSSGKAMTFFMPIGLVATGLGFCLFTVLPDSNSIVMNPTALTTGKLLSALSDSLLHPGRGLNELFTGLPSVGRDILVWLLVLCLALRPLAALLLFAGVVTVTLFFAIGYSGTLRHEGIVWTYLITLYWLVYESNNNQYHKIRNKLHFIGLYGLIACVLLVHVAGSARYIYRDLTVEISSAKSFGRFIASNELYRQAIIIGEPDIRLESLPAYADNRIYLPRAGLFRDYVRLTTENKPELSLGELLDSAKQLRQREKCPVLIALGHFDLAGQPLPYIRTEQYDRKFTWTDAELNDFLTATEKVAEFKSDLKNERYEVYLLQETDRLKP
ncbi:MAG: hypothetical protein BWK76_19245 [Desulfobulbaceae bacterium A2]|nr:MAG: hypothetical protein BWK76_19245 [Desulfobulbaceae bacterium A2]